MKWDVVWKAFIYEMKKGTMKFLLNSITNSGENPPVTIASCVKAGRQLVMYWLTVQSLWNRAGTHGDTTM